MTMAAPPIRVPFEAQAFPTALGMQRFGRLDVDWDDILWAAVTVGRPCRSCVFRHGDASAYEAIFRWSLTRMALQQASGWMPLQRTDAFKSLDPTEKGSVSYFLGLTFCKLFAAKLLDTPWVLHLDVFADRIPHELKGRSRPDLVGLSTGAQAWTVFECKGRSAKPDRPTIDRAKAQAQLLRIKGGSNRGLHVCAFTYFAGDELNFFWADPPPVDEPMEMSSGDEDWRHYYLPLVEFFRSRGGFEVPPAHGLTIEVPEFDLRIEISSVVAEALQRQRWNDARLRATSSASELRSAGFQPDGLRVVAGESWRAKLDWPSRLD